MNSALLKIQKPLGLLSVGQRGRRDWLVDPQKLLSAPLQNSEGGFLASAVQC